MPMSKIDFTEVPRINRKTVVWFPSMYQAVLQICLQRDRVAYDAITRDPALVLDLTGTEQPDAVVDLHGINLPRDRMSAIVSNLNPNALAACIQQLSEPTRDQTLTDLQASARESIKESQQSETLD